MDIIEDKIRRRLAPFVVEGKIETPSISPVDGSKTACVTIQLTPAHENSREVETALRAAVQDLGSDAQIVFAGA
ncbi:MAG: hypothetical protein ACK5JM_07850 [Rhodoblastus sp.]